MGPFFGTVVWVRSGQTHSSARFMLTRLQDQPPTPSRSTSAPPLARPFHGLSQMTATPGTADWSATRDPGVGLQNGDVCTELEVPPRE